VLVYGRAIASGTPRGDPRQSGDVRQAYLGEEVA